MRLLQLLALAAFCLVIFKFIGLAADGAFEGVAVQEAAAQNAAAPAPENNPASPAPNVDAAAAAREAAADKTPVKREFQDDNRQIGKPGDSSETLLFRLAERREEIEKREQDLKLREELLQAAENRLKANIEKIDKFEKGEEGEKSTNSATKDLVTIYESMKPKDAARIFSALSIDILYALADAMNPRKLSAIIAEMDVKAAERLTVELAARAALGANGKAERRLSKIGE